jgi:hypothetical protein
MTVIGVAAERFNERSVVVADVWIPKAMTTVLNATGNLNMALGGRLRAGVSFSQAAAEADTIGRTLETAPPPPPPMPGMHEIRGFGLRLSTASAVPPLLRGIAATFLSLLMGVVSIVLAIACANIAGVLLARATARRREIAVRLALGAGRGRLIRQLLTETMMLFLVGGAAGLLLPRVLTLLLIRLVPSMPVPVDLALPLDGRVAAFTAALSLVAALLSGLMPARQASKADVVTTLKADSQGPSDRLRLRNAFVIAQVAFARALARHAVELFRRLRGPSRLRWPLRLDELCGDETNRGDRSAYCAGRSSVHGPEAHRARSRAHGRRRRGCRLVRHVRAGGVHSESAVRRSATRPRRARGRDGRAARDGAGSRVRSGTPRLADRSAHRAAPRITAVATTHIYCRIGTSKLQSS